jgi:hypothetical protein
MNMAVQPAEPTDMELLGMKTTRVRVLRPSDKALCTIYCTASIARKFRKYCVRLESNVLVPKRGEGSVLAECLVKLMKSDAKHFTAGSVLTLLST